MRNQNTMMIIIGLVIVVLIGFFVIKKIMNRRAAAQAKTEMALPATMPSELPGEVAE